MFDGIFSEKEIKERLLELKEIDEEMHEYLLGKIEFNKFHRLKKTGKQIIWRYLARSREGAIKEYPARFIEEYKKRISVEKLIECINRPSHKKKILYITEKPDYNLVHQSIYLRKVGYETVLLIFNPWLINYAEKYFDTVYVLDSVYTLCSIFKEAKPYLIHVQGNSLLNYFGVLSRLLSKSKIIFNFYDIPSTTVLKDDLIFLGREQKNVELDLFSERFACEKCDGLIIGSSSEAVDILKNRYHKNIPILEFHSYIRNDFINDNICKYSDMDKNIHLVYGGGVAPSYIPEKFQGDIQFHRLIDKLTNQQIYFNIYIPPYMNPHIIKQIYGDYVLLSNKNKFFNFKKGLPRDKIAIEFAKYDFGMMVYFYDRMTKGIIEHLRTRLPDKFFTYLEAGLPILISEELKYPAKLVKDYEIGIVVSQKDLDNLNEIINSYDRKKLMANVKKAREEISVNKQIGRLIDFYEQVVENE